MSYEPLAAFIPALAGTVLMWAPPSNTFLLKRKLVGNGARI